MRVAALYDIHGNLPALEAVLDELRGAGVDRIVVGGDVLPGPMPGECLDALRAHGLPTDFILGNGDREVLEHLGGKGSRTLPEAVQRVLRWTGDHLSPGQRKWVESWPATVRMHLDGLGDVLFCHATPRDDNEIFTPLTPSEVLAPLFDATDAAVVVCGHTHIQFERTVEGTRVVNAGSVGMPFEDPGAYWAVLGPGVELRRTTLDLDNAADRVRQTDYPDAASFAERNIVDPPSREDTMRRLESMAIRSSDSRSPPCRG